MPAEQDSRQNSFRLSAQYQQLKSKLHRHMITLIEERDLQIDDWPASKLRRFIEDNVRGFVQDNRLAVNTREAALLSQDVEDELVGLGPLQELVDDESVDDIVVNGPQRVYVERAGKLEQASIRFADNAHVVRVVQRILSPIGRRIDEFHPMVDARLADGSRVNAIIPPVALDGPCVSIRKFRREPLSGDELIESGSVTREILDFLSEAVRQRRSMIVVGGTGSGKTTFLNLLSRWIPEAERVITIEDAAELRLNNDHVVRLETRPPNLEGEGEVSARDLVRNALRMRPDRIILGEVRGDEVLDMLQAMNTGHEGSMTTLHANSTRDALHRIELLAGFAGFNGTTQTLDRQIGSALDLMVQLTRLPDGRRRLIEVSRVEFAGEGLVTVPLFRYQPDNDSFEAC